MTQRARASAVLVLNLLICLFVVINVNAVGTSRVITSSGKIQYPQSTLKLHSFIGTWYFEEMSSDTIATLYDMGETWPSKRAIIKEVKQLKPDFVALLYRCPKTIMNTTTSEWEIAIQNNWLLKDINGNYIPDIISKHHYAVDIGNKDYQIWVANLLKEKIEQYGYDGVFTDNSLRISADIQWYDISARPINPRTGNYWTDEEVKQASMQLNNEIKKGINNYILVANGISNGKVFFDNINEYTEFLTNSYFDGFMSEGLWYKYKGTWMSEQDWLKSLNMLVWLEDNFLNSDSTKVFVPTTKLESLNGVPYPLPTGCTKEQMVYYAYASTLLGIKTSQNYLCLQSDPNFAMQVIQPLRNIDIGTPLNEYYLTEGTHVYARDFTNIKVLVNPTSSPYTISFQENITNLDGETITEIILEPFTGIVLLR